ncbi:MAG: class I SAM-dependent methyltransferase [Anaerolineae bacterium]
MDPETKNLLYRHPELYESVYPEPDEATPHMCRRLFARYLEAPPTSILDVGCGTGRDLNVLSRGGADCWGVDYLPEMIAYARRTRPHLHLSVGDMRSLRLGRTFDAITCMGSALMYALTNEDVEKTLAAFAAHARAGSLLILDINNAAGYLSGAGFRATMETRVEAPGFAATATAENWFDRRNQWLVRRRLWHIDGQDAPVEDFCRYRLFFPAELEHLLAGHGFVVRGMFDNKDLADSDLSGSRLYVGATKAGE